MAPNTISVLYSATDAAAFPRSVSRSPSSLKYRSIAAARASTSPTGTRRPLTPSTTTSATPPTSVEITGVPTARDSTTLCGKFSQLDESTVASAAAKRSSISSRGRAPSKRTRSPRASLEISPTTRSRSSPSPAISSETPSTRDTASRSTASDFCAVSRPAKARTVPVHTEPRAELLSGRRGSGVRGRVRHHADASGSDSPRDHELAEVAARREHVRGTSHDSITEPTQTLAPRDHRCRPSGTRRRHRARRPARGAARRPGHR